MNGIGKIAIAGLGAVGSAYMSKVYDSLGPARMSVVASGGRALRIREGVVVNGKKYFFPVAEPDGGTGPADLLIFTVKSYQLEDAIRDARCQISADTIIMSLLNGVTSEVIIEREYGVNPLYSLAIGMDATRLGEATVYTTLGAIQFGEATNDEGNYSRRVAMVRDFFESAGIPYEIPRDMKWALWKKFMMNVGINQTSAILRFTYGALRDSSEACLVIRKAMEEAAAVARCEGITLTEDDVRDAFTRVAGMSPEGLTSMAQDVLAKRKTEVGLFGATVAELGRVHGIPTPVNELMCSLILAIENSYGTAD